SGLEPTRRMIAQQYARSLSQGYDAAMQQFDSMSDEEQEALVNAILDQQRAFEACTARSKIQDAWARFDPGSIPAKSVHSLVDDGLAERADNGAVLFRNGNRWLILQPYDKQT